MEGILSLLVWCLSLICAVDSDTIVEREVRKHRVPEAGDSRAQCGLHTRSSRALFAPWFDALGISD